MVDNNYDLTIYRLVSTHFVVNFVLIFLLLPMTFVLLFYEGFSKSVLSLLVLYLSVFLLSDNFYRKVKRLLSIGVVVKGNVTKISSNPSFTNCGIICTYEINGKNYVHMASYVDNKRMQNIKVGSEVTILADPNYYYKALIKDAYV